MCSLCKNNNFYTFYIFRFYLFIWYLLGFLFLVGLYWISRESLRGLNIKKSSFFERKFILV